jgi:hypothetical protein
MKHLYKQEWECKNLSTVGFNIETYIKETIQEQLPEYYEFFPFKIGYKSSSFSDGDFYCLHMEEIISQVPHVDNLKDPTIISLSRKVFNKTHFPSYEESFSLLKDKGFSFNKFTYVGEKKGNKLCWPHIAQNVTKWLNHIVVPEVLARNIKRVKDVIPTPPNYDTTKILNNTFVIESETGMLQGTAFHLKGIGIITCDHCIRSERGSQILEDLKLYRGNDHGNKVSASVEFYNDEIDVAILKVEEQFLNEGLEIGSTDELKQMDHIAVAGFPNYNFGDNGIFTPGLIVGFRVHSGIRHILVNTPLISGNSGGPAIDKNNLVIGIAVTGAEKMSQAHETEKHGIIPIDVIKLLRK